MADKRAFAQFDVGYLDNPKISDVFDASPVAICMHFASVLYCAQHLTDGYIALRTMQRKVGGTSEDATALIDAGLWHEPGHNCDGCPEVPAGKLYVHDYLQHNRTSDGVKGRSSAAKIGAEARWAKEREARKTTDANRIATGDETQCLEREKERKKKTPSSPAAPSKEFEAFWAVYPKKVSKQAALKAWNKAAKTVDPVAIINGAQHYARSVQGSEKQFIKGPDGWLNAGRWEDETPCAPGSPIDVDAILGKDYWTVPEAPQGMGIREGIEWKKARRAEHDAGRLEEAKRKVTDRAA